LRTFFNYIVSCIFLVGPCGLAHGQGMLTDSLHIDSLEIPTSAFDQKLQELDSLVDQYTLDQGEVVTDSIHSLIEIAAREVERQIDSLQSILEKPLEYPKKVFNKADSTLSGITGKIDRIQQKITTKTGSLDKYGLNQSKGLGLNQLFDKNDLIKQQGLLKDLPDFDDLNLDNLKRSVNKLQLGDDVMSKLPSGISGEMDKLAGMGDLNSYLNDQLRQLGVPGTKDWKKAAKDPEYLDKMIDQRASKFAESKYLDEQVGELDKVKKITDNLMKDVPKSGETKDLTNKGRKLVIKNAKDYMSGHEEKLKSAQTQLTKLKKKYSFVGSTSDMKNARKSKSLKGAPLKRRLTFGGNFNMQRGDPLSVDLSPLLMYKLDKKTFIGVSATFRVKLGVEDQFQTNVTQDVYGYSVIGEYKIKSGFFGYGEFEYLSRPIPDPSNADNTIRQWKEGLLIGIGKQFSFTKGLNARLILTYNTFYNEETTPANSPWSFKFGVCMKKLSFKGISF